MPNTFTTNFNLTKPEVGGANDTWGELCNTNFTDIDSQLYRKQDKTDQKVQRTPLPLLLDLPTLLLTLQGGSQALL